MRDVIKELEGHIRESKGIISIKEIKRIFQMKVDPSTINSGLQHLQKVGKIEFTMGGVVWISTPNKNIKRILTKGRTWV